MDPLGFFGLTLGILAVWRVTHLFTAEDGPGEILARLRQTVGEGLWGRLLDCFYCLSLWVALPFALFLSPPTAGWGESLLAWLALSAGAILLERGTAPQPAPPPALYLEDQEEHHELLRPTTGSDVAGRHARPEGRPGAGADAPAGDPL
jgi:hypothetical protein